MKRYHHVPGFLVESGMERIGGLAEAEYCEMLLPAEALLKSGRSQIRLWRETQNTSIHASATQPETLLPQLLALFSQLHALAVFKHGG